MTGIPRFNRQFELRIQTLGGEVIIEPPFRAAFQADKSINGGLNKIQIKLYNIEPRKRLALVKDAEERKQIPIQLSVGYQDRLEMIFRGTINRGSNSREGADIITTIDAYDGGFDFLNSFTSRTVEGGQNAVDTVITDMTSTVVGKITPRPVLTRPKVLVGNSARLIEEMVLPDETWYIDNEQLFIIKDNEVTSRFIPVVSPATGLVNTPERENQKVTFTTLMNPALKIGQRCQLESTTAPHLNGIYRIEDISYQGDNYGDEWTQTVSGFLRADSVVI